MKQFLARHPCAPHVNALALIFLLGAQFLLGIYTNLFVEFPTGILGWIVIHSSLIASLHLYMASVLTLLSIYLLCVSIIQKSAEWIAVSIGGIAGMLIAAFNGVAFAGTQNDVNSFFMAVGFIFAMLCYGVGLYRAWRREIKSK